MYRLPVFYFISYGARINHLLELQRLHRKIHRSRTVQIHHFLFAGSVPLSWLNASLLAHFFNEKNWEKNQREKIEPATCPWACKLGMPSSSRPIHIMYSLFSFHIRSPAQRDVAGSIFSSCFFRSKKLSQLDAIELERCVWASALLLR